MSACKFCGAEIDWIFTTEQKYKAVDPEPVFVIEGEGQDKFYAEEEGELTGRAARQEEVQTREQKINALVGYVPHCRTCRARRKGQ